MNQHVDPRMPAGFEALIATAELPGIGPETRPGRLSETEVENRLRELFGRGGCPAGVQPLIRCVILLWHDQLDPAHAIAQDIPSATGSWLHGIMHRREPDYWNAKYWFRRVGKHPAAEVLAGHAMQLLADERTAALKARLLPGGLWDHAAFVDFCEQAAGGAGGRESSRLAQALQALEVRTLLAHFAAGGE